MNKRPIVVLDTNMLMLMASGIPVLEQIEEELETKPRFIILKPVYEELVKLTSAEQVITRRRAILALNIVRNCCEVIVYELSQSERVDEAIIKFALENRAIVATNDRELRAKLRKLGIPEAYFREEAKRIKIEGYYK